LAAHKLKEIFEPERLSSFKTGVTYLMYGGLGLVLIQSLKPNFKKKGFKLGSILIISGVLLFSLSIFLLCWFNQIDFKGVNLLLGPMTPIGGVLMILGWVILFVNIDKGKCAINT